MTHRLHHHYCGPVMKPSRTASIYPTVDEINTLPEKFRLYIHDLERRCDKSGDVQTIVILSEDRDIAAARGKIGGRDRSTSSPLIFDLL